MMSRRAAVAVGLFAVLALIAVVVGVAAVRQGLPRGVGAYTLLAQFDDVSGIAEGTKVTVAGVRVGEVERLVLQGPIVEVRVRLLASVRAYGGVQQNGALVHGAVLSRKQASLLGDDYLELAPGASGRPLRDGDRIPTVVTATPLQQALTRLDRAASVLPKVEAILDDARQVSHSLAAALGGAEGEAVISRMVKHLDRIAADLAGVSGELRGRLTKGSLAEGGDLDRGLAAFAATASKLNDWSAQLQRLTRHADGTLHQGSHSLMQSLAHIEAASAEVHRLMTAQGHAAEGGAVSVPQMAAQAQQTLRRLDQLVARADRIAAGIEDGQGSLGRLVRDDKLVKSAEQLVERSGSLVRRYTDLELGIDYRLAGHLPRSGSPDPLAWQSHLSLRLQPGPDRYVLATLTRNNLPASRRLTRVTQSSGGDGPPLLQEQFDEIDPDPLRFGLQYARRFGWLTLRGGLLESTAGGGVDLHLLGDRLHLSADLFRFVGDNRPRLRSALTWAFVPHLYLWAGADELLYPNLRASLFAGLGLTFTDNDLLVLFAASPKVQIGD